MIKAIIFDFFGVIGQSTYRHITDVYKPNIDQQNQVRDLHKALDNGYVNQQDFIKQYAEILHTTTQDLNAIFSEAENEFHTSKELLDYIDSLRSIYKTALLSNVSQDAYIKFIQPITKHFDVVVTSYQVQLAKPDKAIFELVANNLQLDTTECLMIDDIQTNCDGAVSVGMQAICYRNFEDFNTQIKNYL